MYSQNNEDSVIAGYFAGQLGNLLDIGAYDGVTFSNSRYLIQTGWSGTLVEPLPAAAAKCREVCNGNPRVSVQEYAIGPENRRITFHAAEMLSTIDAAYEVHRRKWYAQEFSDVEVEQITLEALWALVGRSFDFISIDVENYNIDLVRQIPGDVWQSLSCLCIEHDGHVEEIQRLAGEHGLTPMTYNPENLILGRPRT